MAPTLPVGERIICSEVPFGPNDLYKAKNEEIKEMGHLLENEQISGGEEDASLGENVQIGSFMRIVAKTVVKLEQAACRELGRYLLLQGHVGH